MPPTADRFVVPVQDLSELRTECNRRARVAERAAVPTTAWEYVADRLAVIAAGARAAGKGAPRYGGPTVEDRAAGRALRQLIDGHRKCADDIRAKAPGVDTHTGMAAHGEAAGWDRVADHLDHALTVIMAATGMTADDVDAPPAPVPLNTGH